MLSSLNKLPSDDIAGRDASAYDTWLDFSQSLRGARLVSSVEFDLRTTIPEDREDIGVTGQARPTDDLASSLASTPKLGGQLPIRRIVTAADRLPPGEYSIIVLMKSSSIRKSPKFRGKMKALFGSHARRNSFRILSNERFLSTRNIIDELSRSGHVYVAKMILRCATYLED